MPASQAPAGPFRAPSPSGGETENRAQVAFHFAASFYPNLVTLTSGADSSQHFNVRRANWIGAAHVYA